MRIKTKTDVAIAALEDRERFLQSELSALAAQERLGVDWKSELRRVQRALTVLQSTPRKGSSR